MKPAPENLVSVITRLDFATVLAWCSHQNDYLTHSPPSSIQTRAAIQGAVALDIFWQFSKQVPVHCFHPSACIIENSDLHSEFSMIISST